MGSAQRLPNGDTLFSTGFGGVIFEITPDKKIVWRYVNPAKATGGMGIPMPRGPAPGGPGGPGGFTRFTMPPPNPHAIQLLPGFLAFALQLTTDQRKEIDQFESDVNGKLEKSLSDEQRARLKDLQKNAGAGGPPDSSDAERVLAKSIRDKLKLTTEQDKLIDEIQKQSKSKLDGLLNDEQKKQLKGMRDFMKMFAGGPPGGGPGAPGGPGGRPGGPGGPPGGPGGGAGAQRGGFGFFGFGGGNFNGGSSLFRAYRYGTDYAGLVGKKLEPGKTIEEVEASPPAAQR